MMGKEDKIINVNDGNVGDITQALTDLRREKSSHEIKRGGTKNKLKFNAISKVNGDLNK